MNKFLFKLLFVSTLILSTVFISCSNDDEMPEPSDTPVAGFTFSANELTVTFTNTSIGSNAYNWDFGDGNSSTEINPTYTYEKEGTYDVVLTASNADKSDDESQSVSVALNPENVRLKSGFLVLGITPENTYLAQYFEELPTGTVDIAQGTAFQTIFPLSIQDGAIFTVRTDGSAGFAKIGVNGKKEFVEDGIISTISAEAFSLRVRDSEFGVFHDRNDPNKINTFNPTTMAVTGEIDMTNANALVDTAAVRYQTYIFRGDNEIFVPTRLEAGGNVPNVPLPKVDIAAGAVTTIAELENSGSLIVLNRFGQRYVDESGNLYFYHGGNLSIPTISGAILKIPAGSDDFDPNYKFEVPVINSPQVNGVGSFLSTFYYYKNDIGFALVNEMLDQRILDLVTERGGFQNLTDADIQQIQFWLFTSPTGAWVQIDLVSQSVTGIPGLPPLSPFDASNMTFVGGTPHFAIANPSVNAFFRLDESTGMAEKVFDMTGANIVGVFDLSINE